ncbi:hypothetical protein TNCV_1741911 [Trichonephila clavipes]|nr:hypothetical protein TNCV_1741911 [Trichonephila clavipes]
MTFVQGVRSFFTCPCSLLASPAHLLDCWGISLRQLYEEQDLPAGWRSDSVQVGGFLRCKKSTASMSYDYAASSNPGEGMAVCKCIVPLRYVGTLSICGAACPLERLVEGEDKRPLTIPGVLTSKLGWNRAKSFCHLHGARS